MALTLSTAVEAWPLKEAFTISRGAKSQADVVVVTIGDGMIQGRGECVPYGRYGETIESVQGQIASVSGNADALDRTLLADRLPPGAARNAIDCALWDFEAKRSGEPVWRIAGLAQPEPVTTCFTISLDRPDVMAAKAAAAGLPLLKLKLGGDGDAERLRAVRAAVPAARIVADANEAWTEALLEPLLQICRETRIELVEQPLPAGRDDALSHVSRLVPVCADESAHSSRDVAGLTNRYDAVNIKLDKTGGLSEALAMARAARSAGLRIMTGCMVGTSLAMAPALLLGGLSDWIDLDGPLLLARDRQPGVEYVAGIASPPPAALWG